MRYRRIFQPGATYFFTLITFDRTPLFSDESNVTLWHRAVEKVRHSRSFIVEAEAILPDHLHMIWTLPDNDTAYDTRIRLTKTAFTKSLDPKLKLAPTNASREGKGEKSVWQRRYWEHLIRDERDFQMHLDYIHFNPVKHGLVRSPSDWRHSTFSKWVAQGAYEPWWGSGEMPPIPDWTARE
jgi:putative transposase